MNINRAAVSLRYQSLMDESGGDEEAVPLLPPSYPTSCLVGCVDVVDCVSAETYSSWPLLPDGAREEASIQCACRD